MASFNINQNVKVKLTDYGREMLENKYNSFIGDNPNINIEKKFFIPEPDENGYTTFQMWDLMHIFGNYIDPNNSNIPFDKLMLLQFEETTCEFSVESKVRIQLTPFGYEYLKSQNKLDIGRQKPELDGFRRYYHFWELMSLFGSSLYMGNNNIPFDLTIDIPDHSLTNISSVGRVHR